MGAQLEIPVLPVADPAWLEEIEREQQREQQRLRRLEVRDAVARLMDTVGFFNESLVTTQRVVADIIFDGCEYTAAGPDEAPEAFREVACRLRDAARRGLIERVGRYVSMPRGRAGSYMVCSWTLPEIGSAS